jgi:hypothetical protein
VRKETWAIRLVLGILLLSTRSSTWWFFP